MLITNAGSGTYLQVKHPFRDFSCPTRRERMGFTLAGIGLSEIPVRLLGREQKNNDKGKPHYRDTGENEQSSSKNPEVRLETSLKL